MDGPSENAEWGNCWCWRALGAKIISSWAMSSLSLVGVARVQPGQALHMCLIV